MNATQAETKRGPRLVHEPHRAKLSAALVTAALVMGGIFCGGAEEAKAAFPGQNGKLAYANNNEWDQVPDGIYAVNADGSDRRLLVPSGEPLNQCPANSVDNGWVYGSGADGPSFSSDGTKMVFGSSVEGATYTAGTTSGGTPLCRRTRDLYVANADGSNVKRLTRTTVEQERGGEAAIGSPGFAPDGESVIFSRGNTSGTEFRSVPTDGSGAERVVFRSADAGFDWVRSPSFSPDGGRIVFSGNPATGGIEKGIYVANADGSNVRPVATPEQVRRAGDPRLPDLVEPSFSPDGRSVVFTATSDDDQANKLDFIYVAKADGGSGVRKIGRPWFVGDVALFSPDGRKIAYEHETYNGNTDPVVLIDAEGSGQASEIPQAGGLSYWAPEPGTTGVPQGASVASLSTDKPSYALGASVKANASISARTAGVAKELVVAVRRKSDGKVFDFPVKTNAAIGQAPAGFSFERAFPEAGTYSYFVAYFDAAGWHALSPTKEFVVAQPAPPNTAPSITYPKPAPGSRTYDRTPLIQATVKDKETNLSKANITLYVDGVRIGSSYFSYDSVSDRLSYQRSALFGRSGHSVKIVANDAKGLAKTYSWSFYVR